jgi:hypothetical protein
VTAAPAVEEVTEAQAKVLRAYLRKTVPAVIAETQDVSPEFVNATIELAEGSADRARELVDAFDRGVPAPAPPVRAPSTKSKPKKPAPAVKVTAVTPTAAVESPTPAEEAPAVVEELPDPLDGVDPFALLAASRMSHVLTTRQLAARIQTMLVELGRVVAEETRAAEELRLVRELAERATARVAALEVELGRLRQGDVDAVVRVWAKVGADEPVTLDMKRAYFDAHGA